MEKYHILKFEFIWIYVELLEVRRISDCFQGFRSLGESFKILYHHSASAGAWIKRSSGGEPLLVLDISESLAKIRATNIKSYLMFTTIDRMT